MTEYEINLIELGQREGAESERKRIVVWLRNQKTYWPSDIADAIERGEHRE